MFNATKELFEFTNCFKLMAGKYVWKWILQMWESGGKNIILYQAEFIKMCPVNGDSMFNTEVHIIKNGVKSFFELLAEAFFKTSVTGKELEMPKIPWFHVDKGIFFRFFFYFLFF